MSEDESTESTETPVEAVETPAKPTRTRAKKETPVAVVEANGYAIVETGGKQYRVRVGDRLRVERIAAEAGSEISLDRVLLLGGTGTTTIGAPVVKGASVAAQIEAHPRGEKLHVFKYKAKKRYRRKIGHRQELTEITITGIKA